MKADRFRLINESHEEAARKLICETAEAPGTAAAGLFDLTEKIRADIPEKKRISYGRYSVIKELGLFLFPVLKEEGTDAGVLGRTLFEDRDADPFIRSLGVQLLSIEAAEAGSDSAAFGAVLEYFSLSAADSSWIVRECTAGFIRKLVKHFPAPMLDWYLRMVRSADPMQRRFACESIRPVADNGWLKKKPDFAWTILPELFHETEAYPRTSAGNSLSDWMHADPERTLPVVRQLAANGDKNSYWIAYRACRNLVKKDPVLVMDILDTDHYKYKEREFFRADFE